MWPYMQQRCTEMQQYCTDAEAPECAGINPAPSASASAACVPCPHRPSAACIFGSPAATGERGCARAGQVIIEKRKEEAERLLLEAEKREEEQRAIQARLNEAAEEERRRAERCARPPRLAGQSAMLKGLSVA